jgi:hypothetical protein
MTLMQLSTQTDYLFDDRRGLARFSHISVRARQVIPSLFRSRAARIRALACGCLGHVDEPGMAPAPPKS